MLLLCNSLHTSKWGPFASSRRTTCVCVPRDLWPLCGRGLTCLAGSTQSRALRCAEPVAPDARGEARSGPAGRATQAQLPGLPGDRTPTRAMDSAAEWQQRRSSDGLCVGNRAPPTAGAGNPADRIERPSARHGDQSLPDRPKRRDADHGLPTGAATRTRRCGVAHVGVRLRLSSAWCRRRSRRN
jgi:hypothetical protein